MKRLGQWILLSLIIVGCSSGPKQDAESRPDDVPPPQVAGDENTPDAEASVERKTPPPPPQSPRDARNEKSRLSQAKSSGNDEMMTQAVYSVLARDPSDLVALNALAMHHLKKGRPGLAKLLLQRALKTHPDSAALQNNLGLLYLADGDLQTAMLSFKSALSIDSHSVSAASNLGTIYIKYGDYDLGLPLLETAYSRVNNDAAIANNYAVALGATGDTRKAQEIYKKQLSQHPSNLMLLYNYAILLIDYMNQPKEGASILNKIDFVGVTPEIADKVRELNRKVADGKQ